jgi:hypothetical protein
MSEVNKIINASSVNNSIINPSVPIDVRADIPFVERPYDKAVYQMGGTTPPIMSVKTKKVYQAEPPHPQNVLSVQFNKKSFNDGFMKTYYGFSEEQNIMGKVVNNNSNGNIYRGNQFSLPPLKEKPMYVLFNGSVKVNNLEYISKDQSYPLKDKTKPLNYLNRSVWNKEYPKFKNYNNKGVPMWKYPYHSIKIENFLDKKESRDYFWVISVLFLLSFMYLQH